jgi:hypothetical protein
MTERLSSANNGIGGWDSGWKIKNIERSPRQLELQKNGLTLWAYPEEVIAQKGFTKIGQKVHIKIGKEFRELSPGYYTAIGNAVSGHDSDNVVRIYWNITVGGAIKLMKNITKEFNAINIPFKFKILNNPYAFSRVDGGVLYISKRYLVGLNTILSEIYPRVKMYLNYPSSFFAKALVPGLSLAESPRTGESFGEHRCRILAKAIFNTYHKKLASKDEKVFEVIKYFADLGININTAYLNPNSVDDYDDLLKGAFD